MTAERKISVIGLGYVGLPVAVAFSRRGPVVGFDINADRIAELQQGTDRTREVPASDLLSTNLSFTADAAALAACDFHIVTVPTPVDGNKQPDLRPLEAASQTVGAALRRGHVVVYESTVYPGATEELCVPILESVSGLRHGTDFYTGYSPERINPGDSDHRFETIPKVVAGCSPEICELIAGVYAAVVSAGIHRAPSIRVAEAAKVIENTQRDLNIALMNELAMLFARLGIDTEEVLRAAGTKWNFLPFSPGLVGGHCIGVDPYYLTYKANSVGYTPRVILAGRDINDGMGRFVADRTVEALAACGVEPAGSLVTILGVTFKENIPDTRNTAIVSIVAALKEQGVEVQVHDPMADRRQCADEFGVEIRDIEALRPGQGVVLAVAHDWYRDAGWNLVRRLLAEERGVVFDVKALLDRAACPPGVRLERL